MSIVQKGRPAPDFRLKDQHGKTAELRDFRGDTVILSFHPLAWTKVCAEQMQALEANATAFSGANAIALGVSVDPVPSKKAWAESSGRRTGSRSERSSSSTGTGSSASPRCTRSRSSPTCAR